MNQSGVTLMELLLVIALISVVVVATGPFASQAITRQNTTAAASTIQSFLRKAQAYNTGNRSSTTWGVCKTGSTVRFYSGSCLTPDTTEDYQIPSTVSVGGLTDITFTSGRGEPSSSTSITVTSFNHSKTITVNHAGLIEEQ